MKAISIKFILTLSVIILPISSERLHSSENRESYPKEADAVFLATVPKSGTHLIIKLFTLITGKNASLIPHLIGSEQFCKFYNSPDDFQEMLPYMTGAINDTIDQGMFPVVHTNLAEPVLHYFALSDKKVKKFLMIRDLRDVIVSAAFYQGERIDEHLGPSSIEEKIRYSLTLNDEDSDRLMIVTRRYAEKALKLMEDDSFFVCRFEDLVGEKGGGDNELQIRTILAIADRLEYPLDTRQIEKITEELFGNDAGPKVSVTFRDGQIGTWKKYFTKEHTEIFIEKMGDLQLRLGYSLE